MPILLSDLLKKIPSDTEERVGRAKERVNSSIREAMRRETGLLLNRRDKAATQGKRAENISVPIRLMPGLPTALQDLAFEDENWLAVMISPYRSAVKQSNLGLDGVTDLVTSLMNDERGAQLLGGRERDLGVTVVLVRELLRIVDSFDPVSRILQVNQDVLGVYRYKLPPPNLLFASSDPQKGCVELYWGVIGLIAGMLGVSVEALTAVVLAHEMAHAYTHLGSDIDGERWDSTAFSESDHALKEGLAQYYTCLLATRLNTSIPGMVHAYEELLSRQPPAYQTHVPWVETHRPEEVRGAMLESRRTGIGNCKKFNDALTEAKQRLRRDQSDFDEG